MGGMSGGGKGGGTSTAGGVSPEQMALAQYNFGQGALGDRAAFAGMGNVGMGQGTGATQAIAGTRFGEAQKLADMSDKDYNAMNQFNQQQSSALESLAGQAGQTAGQAGGALG